MIKFRSMKCSIVVPCYNEAESLPLFFERCEEVAERLRFELDYIFVDDGSTDQTLAVLESLQSQRSIVLLALSRNFGKEAAMLAGLREAEGDFVAIMDADLQDPPELLLEMEERVLRENLDSVIAVRQNRSGEPLLLSLFSKLFYRLMAGMTKSQLRSGERDFRLMSRRMLDAILELTEYNRFSKGLFHWVGFEVAYLPYDNQPRQAGKTKWSLSAKIKYALEAFVNFSEAPLDLATYSGLTVVGLTLLAIILLSLRQLFWHHSVSGWTSMIVVILFCFGFTLLVLGIIGKYISNIFLETKKRPLYIIKDKLKK